MSTGRVPEELPEELSEDKNQLTVLEKETTDSGTVTLLHHRMPTASWYVIHDGDIIKSGSKVMEWKNGAMNFFNGYTNGLQNGLT